MDTTQEAKPSIRIAVMGVTGSGKSTFIQRATRSPEVGIGHRFASYTAAVEPFEFELDGHHITLIDTPGFNDTTRSEAEVLTSIANYLDFTYRNPPHLKLNGIIYLQSILDPRLYGSSLRNLKMFKDLCGESPMKNVILATNRWEYAKSCGEGQKALDKELDLRTNEDFWAPLIKRGANMVCWEDNYAPQIEYVPSPGNGSKKFLSAVDLVARFIDKSPKVLQIQTELVEQKRKLIDTTAGVTVNEETIRVEKKYLAEIAQIREEIEAAKAASDLEVQEALEQSRKVYERKLSKLQDEQDLIRYERRNERRKNERELEDLREAYKKQLDQRLGMQKLDFDKTVQTLMANQEKLREEQRRILQAEIDHIQQKPKKERSVSNLLMGLIPAIGGLALSAMGIPVGLLGGIGSILGGGGC